MKKIYLLAVLLGVMAIGRAQSYVVTPSLVVNTTMDADSAKDIYIHFTNVLQSPLQLNWEVVQSTYPSGPGQWFISVCDNGSCYTLPHPVDSMLPIARGDSGFLKLQCVPAGVTGTGTIRFRVYDQNNPTATDTVTFNINVMNITAVKPAALDNRFAVSPSPANEMLHLSGRGGLLDKGTVALYDLSGQRVLAQDVSAVQVVNLRVADLSPGIYMLRYESKAGAMIKKVVVTH